MKRIQLAIFDQILENLLSTHKRHLKQLEIYLWLNNLIESVRDTLNYQNYCRNTFELIMSLRYKSPKLDILIISLCVDGRFPKFGHIYL